MTPLLRRSGVGLPVCSATHRACGSCTTQERNALKALIIIEAMILRYPQKLVRKLDFGGLLILVKQKALTLTPRYLYH